jgi:erythrocyte band 7 integral membrane protein
MSTNRPPAKQQMTLQPSYATEIPVQHGSHGCYESMLSCFGCCAGTLGTINFLPCGCCCFKNPYETVFQGQVGLVTKFGTFYKAVDPGLHFIVPFTEKLSTADIRVQIEDLPSQVVMTRDNVAIIIDSVIYWHVVDPYVSTFLVSNVRKALVERSLTTLRLTMGSRTVQDCIEHRESLANEILEIIGTFCRYLISRSCCFVLGC